MSSTLQISGYNYISTSGISVGVDPQSQVVVDKTLKHKFNFNYDTKTKSYTIKYGENFLSLDSAKPPHVIVDKNSVAYWDIKSVSGHPNTYTISISPNYGWCDPQKGNPRQIYIQEGLDPTQADRQFLISPN
ncbi:hypothetical protein SCLCIDRAFT_1042243 [Scleroderma citrinum Foug A]|uniref:Uncharacterized protein n=1 Tax=Scleroderma citrinum Foug A TaxID=1036808 RepID=A0A0C3DS47_9AGAM|nr:hypothetical protein SCLCIDRAFT_1042243 [Scleroderma citrinum Foug A]